MTAAVAETEVYGGKGGKINSEMGVGWGKMIFFWTQMYHNLPLYIRLVFSLAEGNKVAGIRDYPRLFKSEFSRKDFVKTIGRGGGGGELPLAPS